LPSTVINQEAVVSPIIDTEGYAELEPTPSGP
jgi:hypothetical protein